MILINSTLLSRLFIEPNPQAGNKEVLTCYKKLYGRMFPNPEDYIEFLKAQSIDRQYESAERIVHRLCYHANFPPSYYALLDIICVENYQERNVLDADKYIPRDHFIHIVYLYLLGIYVFFYNSEFYSKIIASNRFERVGVFVGNIKYNCIKDFVSEWKYFCLYHDIGYPAEILGNKNKISNRKKAQKELKMSSGGYKASLGKDAILKHHAYFGSLEIISKLLFCQLVVSNSTENIYPEHKIYRNFKQHPLKVYRKDTNETNEIVFEEIPEHFLTGIQLEKIYSNHCLKKLLPIIDLKNIIIIGLNKESGNVGFITYIEGNTRVFVYADEEKKNSEFKHLLEMPDMVIFDDYFPKTFDFIYLMKRINMEERVSLLVDIEYFVSVYNQVAEVFENDFKGIADEIHFVDFSYNIYYWLFTKIKKRLDNTPLEKYLDSQKFGFEERSQNDITQDLLKRSRIIREKSLESVNEYSDVMLKKCNELLRKRVKETIAKPDKSNSPNKMLSGFIEQYFQTLQDIVSNGMIKKIFLDKLGEEILLRIEEEINLMQLFSQVFIQLKCTLGKSDSLFEYDYIKGEIQTSSFLEDIISKKIQDKMSMPDVATVCEEYVLQHGNTVDHGIISAQYAASVFSCYRNALLNATNKQERLLLSILLDIPNEIEESLVRYIDNYNHVFTTVLFSVFIHNLYPSQFAKNSKGQEYKTNISDPFTYLSLLCDGLQKWNRPRSLMQTLFENHPLNEVSEGYNIDIEGNCLFLSDTNTKDGQWIEKCISSFDSYLANVEAFLKQR